MTDWQEKARLLRQGMANEQPPLKIEKVMEIFGYESESSAVYALYRLQKLGVVKWVSNGKASNGNKGYGTWYLV